EMAGLLYDSLFEVLLPLGDEVIVCPAHGSGSVCGSEIAERLWTTIGLERRLNPKLQYTDRDAFIAHVAKGLERPPYFRRMEAWNVEGPPLLGTLPVPTPLSAEAFDEMRDTSFVLDTRLGLAFCTAHVGKALSIWENRLASFAGWFLPYDRPLLLVNESDDPLPVVRKLIRVGYDNLGGYLSGSMLSWHTAGLESASIETITVHGLCKVLDIGQAPWILDVRSDEELAEEGEIPGAQHIHITQLPRHLDEVPRSEHVTIFCGSGMRSTIAASLLQGAGWPHVTVVLGGLAAWNSAACPIDL
ncbi:MAG: rhodanese-like domain-containing protein, partial [Anaerolineae bacterium]